MAIGLSVPPIGAVLNGKYCLEAVLGEGVMGIVFRALNTRLGQHVAIKIPQAIVLAEPSLVDRFAREAKAAARLRHRNSARVIDVDTSENGVPYLVMEFLRGRDLEAELSERGQLAVGEAVGYVIQACSAMVEAHGRGIVHRDLKPSNLFLADEPDGSVCLKVLDFGVSKFQFEKVNLTAPLAQIGTPLYMSPEQVRVSSALDERTDIWSLGVILYELLAGVAPFNGSATTVGAAIVVDRPGPLRKYRDDIPDLLEAAIFRAMEKAPEDRFQNMREMIHALAPFSAQPLPSEMVRRSQTGLHSKDSVPGAVMLSARATQSGLSAGLLDDPPRRRARALLLGLLALLLLGVLTLGIYLGSRASKTEPTAAAASSNGTAPTGVITPAPTGTSVSPPEVRSSGEPVPSLSADPRPAERAARPPSPFRPRSVAPVLARPASIGTAPPAPKPEGATRAWDNDSPLPPQ